MENLVSVIIPVYNVEKYLPQCIESVINQTYKNLEIILVDDGSPDNCGKICDDYAQKDKRITVIHKKNGGVASARQTGMDICTGDWIYFLDSDDWIELDLFEKVISKACDTDSDAVIFDYEYVTPKGCKRDYYIKSPEKLEYIKSNDYDVFIAYMSKGFIWNTIFSADKIKSLKFKTDIHYADDLVFRFEAYNFFNKFSYIPESLYHYRYNNQSLTNSYSPNAIKRVINLYNELINLIKKYNYPGDTYKLIHSFILNYFIGYILSCFSKNNPQRIKEKKQECSYVIDFLLKNKICEEFDTNIAGRSAKMFSKFKKPNWIKAYILSQLVKLKRCIDRH